MRNSWPPRRVEFVKVSGYWCLPERHSQNEHHPRLYGDGIHRIIVHKREWSYGFKPENKAVKLTQFPDASRLLLLGQREWSWPVRQ